MFNKFGGQSNMYHFLLCTFTLAPKLDSLGGLVVSNFPWLGYDIFLMRAWPILDSVFISGLILFGETDYKSKALGSICFFGNPIHYESSNNICMLSWFAQMVRELIWWRKRITVWPSLPEKGRKKRHKEHVGFLPFPFHVLCWSNMEQFELF